MAYLDAKEADPRGFADKVPVAAIQPRRLGHPGATTESLVSEHFKISWAGLWARAAMPAQSRLSQRHRHPVAAQASWVQGRAAVPT
jgi:hypothetical protein